MIVFIAQVEHKGCHAKTEQTPVTLGDVKLA